MKNDSLKHIWGSRYYNRYSLQYVAWLMMKPIKPCTFKCDHVCICKYTTVCENVCWSCVQLTSCKAGLLLAVYIYILYICVYTGRSIGEIPWTFVLIVIYLVTTDNLLLRYYYDRQSVFKTCTVVYGVCFSIVYTRGWNMHLCNSYISCLYGNLFYRCYTGAVLTLLLRSCVERH